MSKLIKLLISNNYKLTKKDIEKNKKDIGFIYKFNNETALIFYLKFNKNPKLDIIKLLEKEKYLYNSYNNTPLMYYCKNKNIENLDPKIIEYFSNQIGKQNNLGDTALLYYLEFNKNPKLECIELLEKEKDIKDYNENILTKYLKDEIRFDDAYKNNINVNTKIIKHFYNFVGYINFKYYNIEIDLDIY